MVLELPRPLRHLPQPDPPGSLRLLAIGADSRLLTRLRRRGWRVDAHDLDLGPGAALAGEPFTPPVTAWPAADGTCAAVLLLDQLALVVDDEAAIAEAARVLRPGGRLLLRVPHAGPLAWLDSYNLYRYLRDTTRRGLKLSETRGVGWRRHYRRRDLDDLLSESFRVRAVTGQGLGLAEVVRLGRFVVARWLVASEGVDRRLATIPGMVERWEANWWLGRIGYHLVVTAERTADRSERA